MDNLNAQQIVLLTLLVSFVTSIATGITTVSLLEQAPEPITQTINRVVEKTVERVVEVDEETNQPQEKIVETIIVKEEDLTVDAIDQNSKSLARIFKKVGDLETFVGIGIVVSESGDVLTSAGFIEDKSQYVAKYFESDSFPLKVASIGDRYTLLQINPDQKPNTTFNKITFGNSQNLKLGQSIIALSGQSSNIVSTGIVTSLETEKKVLDEGDVNATTTPAEELSLINTSVNPDKIVAGAILLNLQGELVGFKRDISVDLTSFSPVSNIVSFLDSLKTATE